MHPLPKDTEKLLFPLCAFPRVFSGKVPGLTNGKGSVCAYLQSLLGEYGYKTGGFISPHLVTMHERFLINRLPVSDALFMEAFLRVKSVSDDAFLEGVSYPTFFEFLFLF